MGLGSPRGVNERSGRESVRVEVEVRSRRKVYVFDERKILGGTEG